MKRDIDESPLLTSAGDIQVSWIISKENEDVISLLIGENGDNIIEKETTKFRSAHWQEYEMGEQLIWQMFL